MGTLWQILRDLRFGWRMLWQHPLESVVALFTLALGIGANTAIFSVVEQALFVQPMGQQLDRAGHIYRQGSEEWFRPGFEPELFQRIQDEATSWEALGGFGYVWFTLTDVAQPERMQSHYVEEGMLELQEVPPALGRGFAPGDFEAAAPPVVILRWDTFQHVYNGAPSAIGSDFGVNGTPHTVIGVMPKGFKDALGGDRIQAWFPVDLARPPAGIEIIDQHLAGRLKTGVPIETALAEIQAIVDAWDTDQRSENDEPIPGVQGPVAWEPFSEAFRQDWMTDQMGLLFAVALGVLLIACVNIANLLMARAKVREKEFAIRQSVGANPKHLFRQMLAESLLLGLLGGVCGLLLGYLTLKIIALRFSYALWGLGELLQDVSLSPQLLGFALLVTLLASILFGLAPAFRASRVPIARVVNENSRSASGGRGAKRAREALLALEIACTCVLLIGSGLLLKSAAAVQNYDPGFDAEGVVQVKFDLPFFHYEGQNDPRLVDTGRRILEAVRALPGVRFAAIAHSDPQGTWGGNEVRAGGDTTVSMENAPYAVAPRATDQFLKVFRIPLLAGQDLSALDKPGAPRRTLISKTMAEELFEGTNPVGLTLETVGWNPELSQPEWQPMEIIGVFGALRRAWINEGEGGEQIAYMTAHGLARNPFWGKLFAQVEGDPMAMYPQLVKTILEIEPDTAIGADESGLTADLMNQGWGGWQAFVFLQTLFGFVALALALTGIYGITHFAVTQRNMEMGIRLAMGASPGRIFAMILGETGRTALAGGVLGVLVAWVFARFLESELFLIEARDPVVFVAVPLILILAGLAAALVPGRKAMRTDPGKLLQAQ